MEVGDDGRIRTGTFCSAIFHGFTAIVGSGILALPWSFAQLGWILGPFVTVFIAVISCYIAILICDCYRTPDPVNGRRNRTYAEAVKALLGRGDVVMCSIMQYSMLWGTMIGYTIITAISIATVRRSFCSHGKQHEGRPCGVNGNLYMITFGAFQIFLSQCPNLEKVTFLSILATFTSLVYSLVALYLCGAKLQSQHMLKGTIIVAKMEESIALSTKVWLVFQALGNIAFSYTFAMLLFEIQDTLKSPPPENKVMKKVTSVAMGGTALFYVALGCLGYAAFGSAAPGNILTGFSGPNWLVNTANIAVIIHLSTGYQVFAQPIFAVNERSFQSRWPNSYLNSIHTINLSFKNCVIRFTLSRLLLRTAFVILTTVIGMMIPFFNAVLGLLGAISFFPLSVFLPLRMYIKQAKIPRGSPKWIRFQVLNFVCLIVSLVCAIGSVADILRRLEHARLFHIQL